MSIIRQFKCRRVTKRLNVYLDNQVSLEEKKKIEKHLDACYDCSLELSMLNKIQKTLKTSEIKSLPDGYLHELHYKLVKTAFEINQRPSKFTLPVFYPKLRYALICLFILLIPFYYFQHKNKRILSEFGTLATINLDQVSVFKLRITSSHKIEQATLKIEFSDGIMLVKNGQTDASQKELVWSGDLDKGENVIAIYVVGVKRGNWPINASIKQDSTVKKLRMPVQVI